MSMDLNTQAGAMVEYLDHGGYPSDIPVCRAAGLVAGERYEVRALDVHQSISYVYLRGFQRPFNSVCFENVTLPATTDGSPKP